MPDLGSLKCDQCNARSLVQPLERRGRRLTPVERERRFAYALQSPPCHAGTCP